ncbi:MAG: hypothetical protein WCP14_04205 [bacterium]
MVAQEGIIKIRVSCTACEATGLYSGFAEPPGVFVICLNCEGKGYRDLEFQAFTGRKTEEGVDKVRQSAGMLLLTGVGPTGESMTYEEFLNKYPEDINPNVTST